MNKEDIAAFIKQNKELPTLIDLYARFRSKITDPNISAADISDLIASDQAVASRVLRTANSPFYGLMNRITTIAHAIVVIGFNGIHYIVLNTAVFQLFNQHADSALTLDPKKLWQHSSGTGALAKIIAKHAKYPGAEEMFTAGLLHDVGKAFLYRYYTQEYESTLTRAREKKMLIREAEEETLGLTHCDIGSLLLREWNLPETLIAACAHHHNPVFAKEKTKACSIVHLADILCRALEIGSGGDECIPQLKDDAWGHLGLATDAFPAILSDLREELAHTHNPES
jgi:putative nucleotidyltransferase with HDIG domain